MIVEYFKEGDATPIYKRFQEKGRLIPDGLNYVSSWVDKDYKVCFQLMETDEETLIKEWISNWSDLVDFEVFPVMNSEEAKAKMNEQVY